jgi:hypothetical protein
MEYMTLKEAAEKWGVTPRRVNYYCAGERISGAVKMAGIWLILVQLAATGAAAFRIYNKQRKD